MNKKLLLAFSFFALSFSAYSQQMRSITPKRPIVCYADLVDRHTSFGPPQAFLKAKNNPGARTNASSFIVTYIGFDSQSQAAFQAAVDIWQTLLQSPVKIRVRAFWRPLGLNVLGSAIWGNALANFPSAQKLNTYYPVALAEKIAGKDLNHPDSVDIFANFSSDTDWYYGTDGATPAGKTDLLSVVLHEIGHGLGFTDSYTINQNSLGEVGLTGVPMVYDLSLENGTAQNLFRTFASPSADLKTQLLSNSIFYNSPLALAQNGSLPKIYAPSTWSAGSSISHLNEATYPAGNINSLMTPQIGRAEAMHDPGPIVLNMFTDMGWKNVRADHTPVNKEAVGTLTLKAKVSSDEGYDATKVKLKYQKQSGGLEVIVAGTPTGTLNEFSWAINIPNPDTVFYYLSAADNTGREFTFPGKIVKPLSAEVQGKVIIGIGPDVKAPTIAHTAKGFILASATSLVLNANVSDNIGIQSVFVDYWINNLAQPSIAFAATGVPSTSASLKATFSSDYSATINFAVGAIKDGDKVTYRIRATDSSVANNIGYSPSSTTLHSLNVVGFLPTRDSYQNNFNDLSGTDFFGDPQFSIKLESGFNDGAIHTIHPYLEAGNGPLLNFSYQLRSPIRIQRADAIIKFDEVVLVEPGEPNFAFGTPEFYDYVVVEGSKDGGLTWVPLADGYDSRDYAPWLTRYNSSIVAKISQGKGDPTLFRSRSISMLNKFKAGDEVAIRFRLFSDPGAAGWGWAIDNLKIQIDETPPTLLHNHFDYVIGPLTPTSALPIAMEVSDASGVKDLVVEYKVDNGAITSFPFIVTNNVSSYKLDLTISALSVGNDFQYRIRSSDNATNSMILPASDFFHVPIIAASTPVNQYVSDFNSANTDFVGNFFSVSTPTGFSNGAIHSTHPYPNGFGVTNSGSAFTYTLTKPILIDANNPNLLFDEIGIIEPINDYATVEGSKDNGITWLPFVTQYSASAQSNWLGAYNAKSDGSSGLFKNRLVNLTQSGNFKGGDQVLFRFRINANATINAWGWAIDNLSIQGPITGLEKPTIENSFTIYPNPTGGSKVTVKFNTLDDSPVQIQFLSARGDVQQSSIAQPISKSVEQEFSVGDWANGLYLVKVEIGGSIMTKKFIKTQ